MHCDPFTEDQVPVMLRALGNARDQALFALGISTGLRVSELLAIRRRDLIDEAGQLRSRVVAYHTKGDKKRTVPICPLAEPYLRKWLKEQERMGLERGDNPVFSYGTGKVITRVQAWRKLNGAARRACLKPGWEGAFGTHSMRKTFAREMYLYWKRAAAAGEQVDPLIKTQEALGHGDTGTTSKYLNFMLGGIDAAVSSLFLGLQGRKQKYNHLQNRLHGRKSAEKHPNAREQVVFSTHNGLKSPDPHRTVKDFS